MARIAGIDLPRDKRIEIGLTYIYGIGRPTATKILQDAGVNPDTRVRDLTEADVAPIRIAMEHITVEGDLRRDTSLNIKRLREKIKDNPNWARSTVWGIGYKFEVKDS